MIEEKVEILENGVEKVELLCPYCGATLGTRYIAGSAEQAYPGSGCKHFEIVPVGNACYETPEISEICRGVEELKKRAVYTLFSGTTVYLIIPK